MADRKKPGISGKGSQNINPVYKNLTAVRNISELVKPYMPSPGPIITLAEFAKKIRSEKTPTNKKYEDTKKQRKISKNLNNKIIRDFGVD